MHAVESMAYAREKPWHGLGKEVPSDLTTAQMLKAAGLDWRVKKEPVFLAGKDGAQGERVKGQYALIRTSDGTALSAVGENYKPTQNEEVLDFFRSFVEAGDADLETAGSLQDGKYVWCLARLKCDFSLPGGDDVHNYLLFCNPHAYGYGRVLKYTSVRVVCWNTLALGLGEKIMDSQGKTTSYRIPHSIEFDSKVAAAAKKTLGLARQQSKAFEEAARLLAKKRCSKENMEEFFCRVLGHDPSTARVKLDGSRREPTTLAKVRNAYVKAPGQDLKSAKGTYWGALNAVTYVIDHEIGRTRDGAMTNSWMGYTGDTKKQAFALALEMAR